MKVTAFKVHDFRSIRHTGECTLSGDNVTILAGQNEAGKSAVLMALRDFDMEEGRLPATADFFPEGNDNAKPRASVQFNVDPDQINLELADSDLGLPVGVYQYLKEKKTIWVSRDFAAGKFSLEDELEKIWRIEDELFRNKILPETEGLPPRESLKFEEAISRFWPLWPQFVFFDSFQDQLPRQIDVANLAQYRKIKSTKTQSLPEPQKGQSSVEDFIELADIDINRVMELGDQDKALGNYLKGRTATITGDFLTYWKQAVDGKEKVELQVRHTRDVSGRLQLVFYVHDGVDQYPEQRSKGFLWFLSFYLRIAAAEKRLPDRTRLLLIDEPGTYLHAKAQKNVLHLIEDRIACKQQVIYTTHSPYLLPVDKLHRLRIVVRDGMDGTVVVDRLTHPTLRGNLFADTLSPIITAIGLDVRENLRGLSQNNLLVEGLSDYIYVTTWIATLKIKQMEGVSIFPGTGAGTLPAIGSLCIGWGLSFSILLDRDDDGLKVAKKFERELGISHLRIIHPESASTIEDVFDPDEFAELLRVLDPALGVDRDEKPSKAIKRQSVDKILLARKFAEQSVKYPRSAVSFRRLIEKIQKSFDTNESV